MTSSELRQKFVDFFKKKGHKIVPSSSLIPAEPSVLFTSAGMQQFKPYFLGEKSPYDDKAVSCQKCFRTSDIDEVGDERHLTFFEMLGNFSFGGYWKKEAIRLAKEFLDSINIKIDYVTVFAGDQSVPKDDESKEIWERLGIKDIRGAGREDNFWGPTGEEGPCGPTTEIYVNGIEIWNLVFNEYYQNKDKKLTPLKQKGVDTGMGLERLAMVLQGRENIFETDLFLPIISEIKKNNSSGYTLDPKPYRVIADHIKGAVFLAYEEILPSNVERGYVLRRLIRRAVRYGKLLGPAEQSLMPLAEKVIEIYQDIYPELKQKEIDILDVIKNEGNKFEKTLEKGLKEIEKISNLTGGAAFRIYENYSFPL